ncbi:hypothetical protein AAT19DRAFT_10327 [Rhodotorula toruloides]|uniref:Uncharacterized protein n=1 Tax=Rhodotorula toruloides TaxID=5286 RepID=A0A2T0A0E5_RHOTO|nr:hypothetical protein AAT19DRAFT_10327 [Rhodotorula toruloides]
MLQRGLRNRLGRSKHLPPLSASASRRMRCPAHCSSCPPRVMRLTKLSARLLCLCIAP